MPSARAEAVEDPLTPISHDLEPGEVIRAFATQGIFGDDDRSPVAAATITPFSMVVFLMTEWSDGSVSTCSGFMIGPRTVGTAGHCVYDPNGLGWAKRVLAAPGASGATKPFGTVWASNVATVTGWSQRREVASDIAAVTLSSDVGARTGTFQLRAVPDTALQTAPVTVAGYPGDKTSATLWSSSGNIDRVAASLLYFRLDVTHGNSGGPIWQTSAEGHTVVGLVEGGSSSTNIGVRISQPVVDRFRAWIAGTTDTPATTPSSVPSLVASPQTLTAAPSTLSAPSGQAAYAVVTVGATEGRGDLVLTTSGGSLAADSYLSLSSCASGTRGCLGLSGSGTARIVIPDVGNDISAVALTLVGTVARNTTVTVTAQQGATSWRVAIPVRLRNDSTSSAISPGSEVATGRITAGGVPTSGGFGLIVFGGGTGAQLLAASGCPAASAAFWVAEGGDFVTYVPGSTIGAVNAAWEARFPGGIPAGTALMGRCR